MIGFKAYFWIALRKVWTYLTGRFWVDVWSVVLSAIIASLVTSATARDAPKEILVLPNDQGFAKPMTSLARFVRADPDAISVTYDPVNLEEMVVCEFAHLTGSTGREMLFSYLEKYPMCLRLFQTSTKEFTIRPNQASGEIAEKNGQWVCRCP
jgi:hypothetical protein